jgi:prepilin-type N-terminal cleavage/methylation domain-containing protein
MNTVPDRRRGEAGFTLVEVLIATVVGVIVLASSTSLAIGSWRGLTGVELRDGIDRNARFLGTALRRDLQEAGVDLESQPGFGSLMVANDTVSILRVPYDPGPAPAYTLTNVNFADGVCGGTCVEVDTSAGPPQLAAGDLARLQANNQRRLILITAVSSTAGAFRVQFTAVDSLLGRPAGLTGLVINPSATFVQRLVSTTYWSESGQLWRAQRLTNTGAPAGEVVGTGVQSFDVSLVFTDGEEAGTANPNDGDGTNDYDDIAGVRIRVALQADRTDPRVNNGAPLTRTREWYLVPRNLIYERNRF